MKHIFKSLFPVLIIGMCFLLSGCGGFLEQQAFWSDDRTACWPCAIYGTVFESLNTVVSNALPVVCSISLLLLLPIALTGFLTVKIGNNIISPDKVDGKAMKSIIYSLLKAIVVAVVLSSSSVFIGVFVNQILEPLGNLFLGTADALLDSTPATATSLSMRAFDDSATDGNRLWTASGYTDLSGNLFGAMPFQIQELVFRIYRTLRGGVAIGIYILNSVRDFDVVGMIAGLFMVFYGLELTLIVPLVFAEAFFNLGIALLLLPMLLVGWVVEEGSKLIPRVQSVIPFVLTAFLDLLFGCLFVVVMSTTLQIYSDGALNGVWSQAVSGEDLAFTTSAKYLEMNFLVLIVLMVAFRQLAERVGEISGLYGAGSGTSAWGILKHAKAFGEGLVNIAIGAVTLGLTGASALGKKMFKGDS